jgi:hypothetical protein
MIFTSSNNCYLLGCLVSLYWGGRVVTFLPFQFKKLKNMNNFVSSYLSVALGYYEVMKVQEEEMCKNFSLRAEEAKKAYWDACKYPRKTKKIMRKRANHDYWFYSQLAKPVVFTF